MFKLNNMTLPIKFLILCVVLLGVAVLPTTLYMMEIISKFEAADRSQNGIAPITTLHHVIKLTQEHRDLSVGMLSGNESLAIRVPIKQTELNQTIKLMDTRLMEANASLQMNENWRTNVKRLSLMTQDVMNYQITAAESTTRHTQIIDELLLFGERIHDEFGLSLDSMVTSLSLINVTMIDAPKLAENLGQMRAAGTSYLTSSSLSAEGRIKLIGLNSRAKEYFREMTHHLEKATGTDINMKASLENSSNELKAQINGILRMTDHNLIKAQELTLPADQFFEEYTRTIDSLYAFNTLTTKNLNKILTVRARNLQHTMYLMYGAILLALAAAILLSVVIVRSITKPMREAIRISDAVASGNFKCRITDTSTNETGQLFRSLKKMMVNLEKAAERAADHEGQINAISKAQAVIEFKLDGTIITANSNFLNTLGYSLDEIKGKHHRMFVDPMYAQSSEYQMFWEKLSRGEYDTGRYKRIGKNGKEVWIEASYNPIFDINGKPIKVVKYATDITTNKMQSALNEGLVNAVNKVNAVIEFNLDGTIITANDNFLNALGYTIDEVKGRHHSMFVEPTYSRSAEYKAFWKKLGSGEYDAGQYKRFGSRGKEVWIQASYNPIFDMNGEPFKVVKYATDITEQVRAAKMLEESVEQTLAVIALAKEGDFTQQISLVGKEGIIKTLCSGVNELLQNCSATFNDIERVLNALAHGDLNEKITNEYNGIFEKIKNDTNMTVDKLADIVSNIHSSTNSLSTSIKEISAGNSDLSIRTEKQASSLEETAAGMEELTSTVRKNTENALQANQLAAGAKNVAVRGGAVVNQVVETMSDIKNSSEQIVDIISVIDSIAFQTNILALNAAVEAARAGEQGRGFAVVATEVRTLAQRSAKAAKEIKELINNSVSKVNAGAELVDQAGNTMEEIVQAVNRVTDIMSDMSSASAEQGSGIEEINQAIIQMDDVTQRNAALVEEAAAASESMITQSELLVSSVAIFKLAQGTMKPASNSNRSNLVKERRSPNRATNIKRIAGSDERNLLQAETTTIPAKTGT